MIGVLVAVGISARLLGASLADLPPDTPTILLLNGLIGVSVALFVIALRRAALRVTLTVLLALFVGYGVLLIINLESGTPFATTNTAYEALLLGPLSRLNRWGAWLQEAFTLILLGTAVALVFRAQLFSLGAEGQLYFGALAAGAVVLALPTVPSLIVLPLALTAAFVAGWLWGLLPGWLKAYLDANELVTTIMLNVIAARAYALIVTFQFMPPGANLTASAPFPPGGQLIPIVSRTQVTLAIVVVIGSVLAAWLLLRLTTFGYAIRLIGTNRRFAEFSGVPTRRAIMLVMALSGGVAGLAGGQLVLAVHRRLFLDIGVGLAFEGVVVSLLARNNLLVVPFAGLLYAYLRVGAQFMERDAGASFQVVRIIQALIILLLTAQGFAAWLGARRRGRA